MKKVLAFFLLICHMNGSMFLPQAPEEDVYDANGHQLDDITSVVEFFRVEFGYDKTADDENDDTGQNLHLVKNIGYSFQQQVLIIEEANSPETKKQYFPQYKMPVLNSPSFDILTPPPNLA